MADLGLAVCHTLRPLLICENPGIKRLGSDLWTFKEMAAHAHLCSFLPDERCENIAEYEECVCRCQGDEQLVERLSANKIKI